MIVAVTATMHARTHTHTQRMDKNTYLLT